MRINEPRIEIQDDNVVCLTPQPQYGKGFSKCDLVMTKEVFIECYNRWIKDESRKENNTKSDSM